MSKSLNIWAITIAAISAVWLWRKNRSSSLPSLVNNKDMDFRGRTDLSRGYRNNNPLNIRRSPETWRGKVYIGNDDPEFEQFDNMAYGYRAALATMRTYIKNYGLNTPFLIINRWAPAEDGNNPVAYTQRVCKETGLQPDTIIDRNDADSLIRMAYGMSIVENDSNKYKAANHAAGLPNMDIIYQAWELL